MTRRNRSDWLQDWTPLLVNSRAILILVACSVVPNFGACVPDGGPKAVTSPERGVSPIEEIAFAPIEKKDVILAFNRDKAYDILYVLNLLKGSPINYAALEAVACAVAHCDLADENWNWEAINSELVRVNLIDVLLQADKNGFPILDSNELLSEVLSGLDSKNPQVVQRSLLILGFQDRKEIASEIERVARATKNDTTFRVAIISLKWMSPEHGGSVVARIREDSNAHRQAIVDDVIPQTH